MYMDLLICTAAYMCSALQLDNGEFSSRCFARFDLFLFLGRLQLEDFSFSIKIDDTWSTVAVGTSEFTFSSEPWNPGLEWGRE